MQPALKCASREVVLLVPVAVLLAVHVRRSRFPARVEHLLSIGSAGLCGSAVVWLSCRVTRLAHLAVEHSGATALAVAAATLGVGVAFKKSIGR